MDGNVHLRKSQGGTCGCRSVQQPADRLNVFQMSFVLLNPKIKSYLLFRSGNPPGLKNEAAEVPKSALESGSKKSQSSQTPQCVKTLKASSQPVL